MARLIRLFVLVFVMAAPCVAAERWETLPTPAAMPTPVESGRAAVNGIALYYAVFGAGPPVIVLHGGLGHADRMANQVIALARGHRVIAVDSRGHGRSTRSADPYSYALMARDVVALMDHLGIAKASIVGWSDGGIIGLEMAMNHADRVSKVFAFGANTNVAGLRDGIDKNPTFNAYIARAGEDYARMSPTPGEFEGFVAQIGQMWATEPNYTPAQLATIKAPVVIADGEHDEAIRQEHDVEMAKAIPGAKLVIFKDASHFAHWQDPKSFNDAVLTFLDAP